MCHGAQRVKNGRTTAGAKWFDQGIQGCPADERLLAGGGFIESIGSALAAVNARTQSTVKWDNPYMRLKLTGATSREELCKLARELSQALHHLARVGTAPAA